MKAKPKDVVLKSFEYPQEGDGYRLPVYVLYCSPLDYPGKFVVRLFDVDVSTPYITVSETLEAARRTLPRGLFRSERTPADDPVVVETWF